ncbi:sigma-70 family RNA polymerase sigma factor [Nocardiopsis sp. CNT312]|uniref:sigma-70 family RNA polymerase sigma factor n=1 Tax=Nocardiopsis sp. CNT312 TaxID=1137268 RepID=UPI00048C1D09|nr:sigma-70 family RNA polymerase sigma factor [Nocardiopsis sp. CNT312]
MGADSDLVEQFERSRRHLRGVAFRILGSADEADDAVQEAWLRVSRADSSKVANMPGWLTTIVGRICLDMLRSRRSRYEACTGLDGIDPPAPRGEADDPESEAVLADSVGLALLVVLDRLGPGERLAFVLHDLFAVPFAEIAEILDRTPAAAKKMASRARHRLQGTAAAPGHDLARQRKAVDAFLVASRAGDLDGLVEVLAPGVVRRADRNVLRGGEPAELRGAAEVAKETAGNAHRACFARTALVDGAVGAVVAPRGRLLFALRITVDGGRITRIDVVGDPQRLQSLDLSLAEPVSV